MRDRSDMQADSEDIDTTRTTAFLRTITQPKAKKIFEQLLCGGLHYRRESTSMGNRHYLQMPILPSY